MSTAICIVLDTRKAGRSAAGLVFTGLEVRIGSHSFPESGWVDFSVVVLSSWGESLWRLLGGQDAETLHWMEGPFAMRICRKSEEVWALQVVERTTTGESATPAVTIDPIKFSESLLDAADIVLQLCLQRGWCDRETDRLQRAVGTLSVNPKRRGK